MQHIKQWSFLITIVTFWSCCFSGQNKKRKEIMNLTETSTKSLKKKVVLVETPFHLQMFKFFFIVKSI